jgi:hypothetical protein
MLPRDRRQQLHAGQAQARGVAGVRAPSPIQRHVILIAHAATVRRRRHASRAPACFNVASAWSFITQKE